MLLYSQIYSSVIETYQKKMPEIQAPLIPVIKQNIPTFVSEISLASGKRLGF